MFEMSSTSASDRDLCNDSCVVNDWLTNDDDDHSGTDDTVDVIPSVNHRPTVGKSTTTTLTLSVTESPMKQEILNTAPYFHTVPTSLDFTSLIVDLVHQYASQVCHGTPTLMYGSGGARGHPNEGGSNP